MNFTPRANTGTVAGVILIVAVVGLIGWGNHVTPAPVTAAQSIAAQQSYQMSSPGPITPAVEVTSPYERAGAAYQPISAWYKNKHWWKRNAPIIGGAGGGALIGGLAGGGTGALIGGAVGGGGGYAYKRLKHRHNHHHQ
jgi:hypothetical protein